jgi:AAA+ superfamily predicted ATPase
VETFEVAGARFTVAEGLLADPPGAPQPVLFTSSPKHPRLELTISAAREGAVRLEGRAISQEPGFDGPLHQFLLGTDYVEPLLDTLGRLLNAPLASGPAPEKLVRAGLTFSVTAGRPKLDGQVTDTIEIMIGEGESHGAVEVTVRTLVEVAQRRAADAAFLRDRAYEVTRERPSSPIRSEGVRLDDLGGLDDIVRELRDVADSFRHPEVMARWGARRPQGILMWGPPGTGKTTLAKALATEIGGTLKEIRTPDILDQWMGASERNIKRIFTEARAYTDPTVLLFDEFDSIISYAGAPRGSADQAVNSVAGIFKQEMNTLVDENPNVIVVATTNFPNRVDDSLIRSGRFDVKIAVPLPEAPAREDILRKMIAGLTARHTTDGFRMFTELDLTELAERAAGLSGADLKEVLRRAQMAKAMTEARGETPGPITQADLLHGIRTVTLRT